MTAADRFQSFSAEAFTRISCDFPLQHSTSAFTSIVFSPQPNPSSKQTFQRSGRPGRSPNKRRCRGRKQLSAVSGVNETIIALIIMASYRILVPANQKTVCEVRRGGMMMFTALGRLERFFHTKLANQCVVKSLRKRNMLAKPEKGPTETMESLIKSHLAEM